MQINLIGSGWLAKPLAQHLLTVGHRVWVTTTQTEKIAELEAVNLRVLRYSLGDQLSDPSLLFDTDVLIIAITSKDLAAFNVLMDQINDSACKHIVFISSTSVYLNDGQSHDESSEALNHDNPLLQIERLIQTHPSTTIIRMAGLVGPGRHPGRFFQHGKVLKNPNAAVNLIHLDDCIGVIESVIEHNAWNEIINACANTHPDKITFYTAMANQMGLPAPICEEDTDGSFKIIANNKLENTLKYALIHADVMKMKF